MDAHAGFKVFCGFFLLIGTFQRGNARNQRDDIQYKLEEQNNLLRRIHETLERKNKPA
jgi:hypothetical protein